MNADLAYGIYRMAHEQQKGMKPVDEWRKIPQSFDMPPGMTPTLKIAANSTETSEHTC